MPTQYYRVVRVFKNSSRRKTVVYKTTLDKAQNYVKGDKGTKTSMLVYEKY